MKTDRSPRSEGIARIVRTRRIALPLVLAALAAGATAQEPIELPHVGERQDDAAKELVELFHRVERNLERIDDELADAGAGEVSLDEVDDAGLDDLLRNAQRASRDVEAAIERILEIAAESGATSSAPGGGSPLDQQRDQSPQQRERTPDAPQPSGEPDPQGQDKEPQGPDPEKGETRAGGPPNDPPPGTPSSAGRDAEQWGFLPDRLREVFRNQGRDDLPVRYRTWIDAYYRRLNRVER